MEIQIRIGIKTMAIHNTEELHVISTSICQKWTIWIHTYGTVPVCDGCIGSFGTNTSENHCK
jgi:hypothetical protein